jgi:hypothetical protein
VVRDPDSVQTGRDTLFHRESSGNLALTPTLSHPKQVSEGEDWDGTRDRDGTRCFTEKCPKKTALTPIAGRTGRGRRWKKIVRWGRDTLIH